MVYNYIICLPNRNDTTRLQDIKCIICLPNRYETTRPTNIKIDGIQLYNMFT